MHVIKKNEKNRYILLDSFNTALIQHYTLVCDVCKPLDDC